MKRQVEMKSRALPFLAHDADLARVQFENSPGNRQPQPHEALAVFVLLIRFVESFEYVRQGFPWNTRPGVGDGYANRRR